MAGRLSNVASRIMGGNGVVCHSVASSLCLRVGMGLPVGGRVLGMMVLDMVFVGLIGETIECG